MAAILKDETDLRERLAAVKALYMLSFDEENKDIIKDDSDIMDLLQNLHNSGDKEIQQAASGVIWEIAGKEEHNTKSSGMFALSFFLLKQYFESILTLRAPSTHGEKS